MNFSFFFGPKFAIVPTGKIVAGVAVAPTVEGRFRDQKGQLITKDKEPGRSKG
jgi:hypothetical protein